jgi:hypothetical protein
VRNRRFAIASNDRESAPNGHRPIPDERCLAGELTVNYLLKHWAR